MPDVDPWPATFHAGFYAPYRAGFEPILGFVVQHSPALPSPPLILTRSHFLPFLFSSFVTPPSRAKGNPASLPPLPRTPTPTHIHPLIRHVDIKQWRDQKKKWWQWREAEAEAEAVDVEVEGDTAPSFPRLALAFPAALFHERRGVVWGFARLASVLRLLHAARWGLPRPRHLASPPAVTCVGEDLTLAIFGRL
ncbi:hypothetical protein C8R44DRAFT_992834 [Mycena epipterygia]|nr:hypothetical protein C8R44DRAFT_992834 [Mycena epipterygia]